MKPAYRAMICLLVLLSAHDLRAAEPPHLVIEAPQPLLPLAERLRGMSPLAFLPVMELVGLEHPGPPILVVLALEGSEPARLAPSWAAGYAVGRAGMVVLLPERIPSYPYGSIEAVLEHEVAHVLIARAARGRPIPGKKDVLGRRPPSGTQPLQREATCIRLRGALRASPGYSTDHLRGPRFP